jgi:hypothetical protein
MIYDDVMMILLLSVVMMFDVFTRFYALLLNGNSRYNTLGCS